jgi:hypothetical protein
MARMTPPDTSVTGAANAAMRLQPKLFFKGGVVASHTCWRMTTGGDAEESEFIDLSSDGRR